MIANIITLRERYDQLTEGQKRVLINKYTREYSACIRTFFYKINGKTKLRATEVKFFESNLCAEK